MNKAQLPTHADTFGSYLRLLRRRARLSQTELSVAVGYSTGQISMLENGQRAPDVTTVAARFADALGLDPQEEAALRLLDLARAMVHPGAAAGQSAGRHRAKTAPPPQTGAQTELHEEELGTLEEIPPLPDSHVRRPALESQINEWLRRERRAVLCGLPGMGKTTLAAAFAHHYARHHPVFWLTLELSWNQTPEELLRQLALFALANDARGTHVPVLRRIAAGSVPGPIRQQIATVCAALQGIGSPLLIFDDAHHVASRPEIMELFRTLAARAPYCRLLFATREALELAGLSQVRVDGLERNEGLHLAAALSAGSASDSAPASDPNPLQHFDPLFVQTAGNPLLLRLGLGQLGRNDDPMRSPAGNRWVGQLATTLLERLPASPRRLAEFLAIWRGPLDLAEPLLAEILESQLPGYAHAPAVEGLERGQMILQESHAYLHPLVRKPLEANLAQRRSAAVQLHRLAASVAMRRKEWVEAAHHWTQAGDWAQAAALLTGELTGALPAGQIFPAVAVIDQLLDRPGEPAPAEEERTWRARLLARRGDLLINTLRAAEARANYRAAMQATAEPVARAQLAHQLARSLLHIGQARDALQLCEDAAQTLAHRLDADSRQLRIQLGGLHTRALIGLGQLDEAATFCTQAIEVARTMRLEHPTQAEKICAEAWRGLGYIARRQGRVAEAKPCFERAAAHARAAGLQNEEAETLIYLSATMRDLGDFAGAGQTAAQALVVAEHAGNDFLASHILHHISITGYYHNDLATALACSQQAAHRQQQMGDSEGLVSCDILQALVFAAMGDLGPAAAAVERARANSQLFDNRWLQGMALYVYGIVHTFGIRLAAAEQALGEALQIEEFASDRPMRASALLFLGINAVAQGKLAEAHAVATQVPPEIAEKSTIEVALLAGLFRGMLCLAAGDSAGAAASARQTRRRGEESGYLIYAAEAGQILQAVATPPALAQLPAFVCCQFEQSPAGRPAPSPTPLRSPLSP